MMTTKLREHQATRLRRGRGAWPLWAALVVACGPDPKGKFESFLEETNDERDVPPPKEDVLAPGGDINGQFLMAISTVIAVDLPLQFLVTNTLTVTEDGTTVVSAELQPLSLNPGARTKPREPVGDPLSFAGVEVVDGKFAIDAGTVMVTGAANPITGSDIVATLRLEANIISEDFYCGKVLGDVTSPLMASIEPATFAAVRVADPTMLPADVTINCEGATVTDDPPPMP
jgi:hypothetical protein